MSFDAGHINFIMIGCIGAFENPSEIEAFSTNTDRAGTDTATVIFGIKC